MVGLYSDKVVHQKSYSSSRRIGMPETYKTYPVLPTRYKINYSDCLYEGRGLVRSTVWSGHKHNTRDPVSEPLVMGGGRRNAKWRLHTAIDQMFSEV